MIQPFVTPEAAVMRCPSCGAPARRNSPGCDHCGARLATMICPCCLGKFFEGAKFCSNCGATASRWVTNSTGRPCPKCSVGLATGTLNGNELGECPQCFGFWLDRDFFGSICAEAESRSVPMLGQPKRLPMINAGADSIRHRPCPICGELMNRVNFAKCSGVVIDVCNAHGSWFDHNEVQSIVTFIRSGGMKLSRDREAQEKADAESRRRFREISTGSLHLPVSPYSNGNSSWPWVELVACAARAIFELMD